ncbi:putative galactose oxidase/kelch, beta-propeller, galactose oxidase, beta-propeller [Rosa chinensis]|uniref:Putative galactose oxidase/kelch, beta-propeller, galactose oxidase, beta-propeller n=1 Tax=Rosa chinensis TaxID=74649 RepID=A0A2P6PMP0_ROSCH|nr:putative galactose oxidase/kelch, beta-propeller, galactose oxidase, beta-propeller [Rosa chinensis]
MPEDKPIYVRVLGRGKIFWYVIEGEPPAGEASDSEGIMIECRSECDRIRQLSLPGSDFDLHDPKSSLSLGFFSNNLLVLQSRLFLIGGDVDTRKYGNVQDETVGMGFRHLNLANKSDWVVEGGYQEHQFGGAAVAPDGSIYSVGYNQYVMSPIGYWERCRLWERWERLPTPPLRRQDGTLYETRLLGVTLKKLIIYTLGGGLHHANVMLSFDLESGQWDEDFLDDNFWGEWSAGVVLYNDRYLFTFGDRSPKPSMSKVQEERQEPSYLDEEEVPGIYVFDLERGQWLPEPVEGLENNGTILPTVYKPNPELCCPRTFSPYLFQIGNHDNRRLALLWDGHGRHPTSDLPQCEITWSKFILTASTSTTTTDQTIHFSAHVLSNGFCPLAEFTSQVLNCAV